MADVITYPTLKKELNFMRKDLATPEVARALAAMIFLRWADFQDAEKEAIAAFEDAAYEPVLPPSLHWRSWHQLYGYELEEFFTYDLAAGIMRHCGARNDSLAIHLQMIAGTIRYFDQLPKEALGTMVNWLAMQPFETDQDRRALLDVFDDVLNQCMDRHRGYELTPKPIAQLMVALAEPSSEDRIYDPCLGTAGFLTSSADFVREHQDDKYPNGFAPVPTLCGRERVRDVFVIGLTRLVLAGVEDPQIDLGNSLESDFLQSPKQDGFDIVITNPPWGGRIDLRGLENHYPIQTNDSTSLFLQHVLFQLRLGGRAVFVVPQGFLFKKGPEQRLRQMLLEEHTLEAVVSLPERVFAPYSNLGASILMFRRGGQTAQVKMIDGSFLFSSSRRGVELERSGQGLETLLQRIWGSVEDEYCWRISVETLKNSDWDLTPQRRDLSGLQSILEQLRSSISVALLKDCCDISSGRNIKSSELVDAKKDGESIPYVRIGDVQNGQVGKGSSWISRQAEGGIEPKWKLRAGDILVSKSGTIGKVGMVRNGAVGAVATSGFYILRPNSDRLDPHFLVAYLNSSECRSWLSDNARGAVIRHLTKSVIEGLPLPLPDLQLQLRVANAYRDHGEDALPFLSQILLDSERDQITEWVEKATDYLHKLDNEIKDDLKLRHLDFLSKTVYKIRREVGKEGLEKNSLGNWLLALSKAVIRLQGVHDIPKGAGLFSILQEAIHNLEDAIELINGYMPNEAKARGLTRFILDWLEVACSELLEDVQLVFRPETDSLPVDQVVEVEVAFQNLSALPLRDLQIETNPDTGGTNLVYLPENGANGFVLYIESPKVEGIFSVDIYWSAMTLDGQSVSGEREIAFNVLEGNQGNMAEFQDVGGSPYVCGDPVKPERKDVFFGREVLLDQIHRQISKSGNVVVIEGNRRTGKSSVLWHLEGANKIPGWLGVYCSFQGTEGNKENLGVETVEVFRSMAYEVARSLRQLEDSAPLPDGSVLKPGQRLGIRVALRKGISEESPFSDFREYLEVVLEILEKHGLKLLLMLDELDKLQEGIDNGVTSSQIPENIRFLIHQYPNLSAIITGSRVISRLKDEYWSALFGMSGLEVKVSFLAEESARQLIVEPVKGRLIYTSEAVAYAIRLTSGQPFLLQCLCNRVFMLAANLKTHTVTLELIQKARELGVEENKYLGSLWEFAGTYRRRLILALAQKSKDTIDDFRLGVILEQLSNYGVEVDDDTLIADLTALRELEIIKLIGESRGGHYELSIPLMGEWIEKNQDFEAILSKARSETEDQNE